MSDRPIPSELTRFTEFLAERLELKAGLDHAAVAEVLAFTREVKHAPTAANPAVAAFLAGWGAGASSAATESDRRENGFTSVRRVL